jgi:ATP adenylyltransferase
MTISANTEHPRRPFDLTAYVQRSQSGPCFVCEIVAGNPAYRHHIVYEDDIAIAFLNKYPVLYGYTLVAPRQHREHVTGDFTLDEYQRLQCVIYRVAEAVRRAVPTERVYILSLGSQQGNRHVHWHIAPLPPGVPYEEQQLAALNAEKGILALSDAEMAALAARTREAMG